MFQGCLIYGFPVGAKASTSICEGLTKDNILELTRLYCDDGYGYTTAEVSMVNLVSNTGVVANDTTGIGTARRLLAASGYSTS